MRKYIIRRLLISVVILFFVAFVIYALMRCLPTSYVEAMARQKSMQPNSKSYEEWMEQLSAMYNMDGSIIQGFFQWLGQILRGDFGDSWKWTVPVIEKFNDTVWLSFIMGVISFALEIIIAIPLGIIAATKQYSVTDYIISIIALAGISLPTFFFASLLKLVFSVRLGWFDLYGLVGKKYLQLSPFGQFMDKAYHLVLPITVLVVISMGSLMRYTRTNMLEVLSADYIRTARAKGLSEHKVVYYHAFRNTLIPIASRIIRRSSHHRDSVRYPGYRFCFLSINGIGRHTVLHVLHAFPGDTDLAWKSVGGRFVCRCRPESKGCLERGAL